MTQHGPLNIETFVEPMFQENGLLLWPQGQADCWFVDPGFPPQPEALAAAVHQHGLKPQAILLTHCHADHLAGVRLLQQKLPGTPLWAPRDEEHMLGDANANLSAPFGFRRYRPAGRPPALPGRAARPRRLELDRPDVGGHSPGGLAYTARRPAWSSSATPCLPAALGATISGQLATRLRATSARTCSLLSPETVVYSGHGPTTTVARESL